MNEWGRIFFKYEYDSTPKLQEVLAQPLRNHSDNCKFLLESFHSRFFTQTTKDLLLHAAKVHDNGKRESLRIYEDEILNDNHEKRKCFRYSFAGHRFRAVDENPYIASLIRAHHEFSVSEINRCRGLLSSQEQKKSFPNDLYLLCMADQLEAELAVKTVERKEGSPRSFMDFATIAIDNTYQKYTVIPWPFSSHSLQLTFELYSLPKEYLVSEKHIEEALRKQPLSNLAKQELTIQIVEDSINDN